MTKIEWTDRSKWCTGCTRVHPVSFFGVDASRADGLNPTCQEYKNRRARASHVSRAVPGARYGVARLPERDGDKRQARRTVDYLVETSAIPSPNALPCTDCHEYDHHLGYGTGNHLKVEVVCSGCHHTREGRRG